MKEIYFCLRNTAIGKKIRNSNHFLIILLKKLGQFFMNFEWKEKKTSFGEKNDKLTIYIIRRRGTVVGLFSYIFTVLARIKEAEDKNWIPVVDMKNYPNGYLEEDRLKKDNVWEYYFLQPAGVSLDEAYQSKNVILSNGDIANFRPKPRKELFENTFGELDEWRRIVKKYLILNEDTKNYIHYNYNKLICSEDRVLGIICRGTDYAYLKPKGHPIQPTVDEIVEKAIFVLKEYKLNKIFVATEDKGIFNELKERLFVYANIVTNEKKWIEYKGDYLIKNNSEKIRKNDKFLSGLEYLTTIYILSRSNCLIGGRPGGATAAMIISEGFEYTYFWDKGYY